MIFNLLITSIICLFSFGSVHNSYVHQPKEEKQVQNLVYNDEYGLQLYMFTADFMSNDFLYTFVAQLSKVSAYQNFNMNNRNNLYAEFSVNAGLYEIDNYVISTLRLNPVTKIVFNKQYNGSSVIGDIETDKFTYSLYINNNDEILVNYTYLLSKPVVDEYEHILGENAILYCTENRRIQNQFWCYKENSLEGNYHPFIDYYFYYRGTTNYELDMDSVYQSGYGAGNQEGFSRGYNQGKQEGYQSGYTNGIQYAQSQNQTALTIFTGIIDIGLLPINVFLAMFNYEVFGINIAGFVSSLLTIAIVVIVIRIILGGKTKDD